MVECQWTTTVDGARGWCSRQELLLNVKEVVTRESPVTVVTMGCPQDFSTAHCSTEPVSLVTVSSSSLVSTLVTT